MYHTIDVCTGFITDVEVSPTQRLERLRLRKGTQVAVSLRPYVVEEADGLVEVADLYFEDGSVARGVRFEQFRFAE
jgi:hypothetical protein